MERIQCSIAPKSPKVSNCPYSIISASYLSIFSPLYLRSNTSRNTSITIKKYQFTQRSTATPRGMNEIGIFVLGAVQTHLKSHFIPKDLQTFTRLKAQNRDARKNNKRASQNVFASWDKSLEEPGHLWQLWQWLFSEVKE